MAILFKSTKLLSNALKDEQRSFVLGLRKFIIPAAYLDDVVEQLRYDVFVLGRIGDEEDDWLFMIIAVANRDINLPFGLEVIMNYQPRGEGKEISLTPASGKKEVIRAKDMNGVTKSITFTQETPDGMPTLH